MYTRTCARSFDISCYYGWVFSSFTTDRTDWTDECPVWEQNKNQINPLERMEGVALMSCFRLGLIRASS